MVLSVNSSTVNSFLRRIWEFCIKGKETFEKMKMEYILFCAGFLQVRIEESKDIVNYKWLLV